MAAVEKTLLGKIFISHSSQDKKFVRMLVSELEARGFSTWLDERALHVGDPLAKSIGEAIAAARVVIVIISEESLRSNWVRYELNHAAELMIKGKCRLIPILIGAVEPPPEIRGILYADFRKSFKYGLDRVLDALQHECKRYASKMGFWFNTKRLLLEEFADTIGVCSISSGEYKSLDYSTLGVGDGANGTLRHVVYEIVPDYVHSGKPLSTTWWEEYSETLAELGERFALLVSERPIGFAVDSYVEGTDRRLALATTFTNFADVDKNLVIVIDMSGELEENQKRQLLKRAKQIVETME